MQRQHPQPNGGQLTGGNPQMRNPMQGDQANEINQVLAKMINSQPVPDTGWHATANKKHRFGCLHQIFTMISLSAHTQSNVRQEHISKVVTTAGKLEHDLFVQAPNVEAYNEAVKLQLHRIKNMGAQKAHNIQALQASQSMQPPPLLQQQNLGIMAPNFNANHSSASFPNNNNPLSGIPPQAATMPLLPGGQTSNPGITPQMLQQNYQKQQQPNVPSRPQNGSQWSAEDQQNISNLAKQMLQRAQQTGHISELQARAARMTDAQKAQLAQKLVDPINFQIRGMAEKQYMQKKAQMQSLQAQGQNPQQRPDSTGPMRMQGSNHGSNANNLGQQNLNFDPTDFAGQQAEALRSQAFGDLVVPASNNQAFSAQQLQFSAQGAGSGQNPAALRRRPPQPTNPQGAAMPNQQSVQAQARAHAQARSSQAKQTPQPQPQRISNQDRLQGQVGGLHSFDGGVQPSPMRTLNQPLGPPTSQPGRTPQQSHAQPTPGLVANHFGLQANNPGPSPQVPLMNRSENQQAPMVGASNAPLFLQHMPPAAGNLYRALPAEMRARLNAMQPEQFQQALSHIQRTQQNRAFLNQQGKISSLMPQAVNNLPQPPGPPAQIPNAPPAQRPDLNRDPNGPQQNAPSPAEQAFMDSMQLPRNHLAQMLPSLRLPPNILTWGEFKQWFRGNPSAIPLNARQGMSTLQKKQFFEARKRMMQQAGQANAAQNNGFPINNQESNHISRTRLGDLRQREVVLKNWVRVLPTGVPQVVPISSEDVQNSRMQLGQRIQGQSDEQIRKFLLGHRLRTIVENDPELAREMNLTLGIQQQQQQPAAQNTIPQLGQQGMQDPTNPPPNYQPRAVNGVPPRAAQNSTGDAGQGQGKVQNSAPSRGGKNNQGAGRNGSRANTTSGSSKGPQVSATSQNKQVKPEQPKGLTAEQQKREAARLQDTNAQQANQQQAPAGNQARPNSAGSQLNMQLQEEYSKIRKAAIAASLPGEFRHIGRDEQEQYSRMSQDLGSLRKVLDSATRFFFARGIKTNKHGAAKTVFEMLQHWIKVSQQKIDQCEVCISLEEYRARMNMLQNFVRAMTQQMQNLNQTASGLQTQDKPQETKIEQEDQRPSIERSGSSQAKIEDQAPAAPTSEKPPMNFLTASPHGTPQYAPSNHFDFNKMAVPQKRKRKTGEEGSALTPGSQAEKVTATTAAMSRDSSTSQRRPPMQMKNLPFKCPIPQCEFEHRGFGSQEQADSHSKEAHGYKGDALDWCLGAFREALNLDRRGRPLKKALQGSESTDDASAAEKAASELQKDLKPGAEAGLGDFNRRTSSAAGKLTQQDRRNHTAKLTDEESWKHSNIARESLQYIFTGLKDFPAAGNGLAAFADSKPTPPEWPADAPGFTVQELADQVQTKQEKKSISPSSIVRVELEDWDPFAGVDGGVDSYEGMEVEVVKTETGGKGGKEDFVATDYNEAIKMLGTEEWQKEILDGIDTGADGKENFDFGDWSVDWDRVEFDEKGGLESGGTPPKKIKTSP